jgi:hypothetical protein
MPKTFHVQQHLVTTIHLYELVNIDIHRKGRYSIEVKLYSEHPSLSSETFYLDVSKDSSPTTSSWTKASSNTDIKNSGSKFSSSPFDIEYTDQVVTIDKLLRFSTVVQIRNYEEGEVDVLGLCFLKINNYRTSPTISQNFSSIQRSQGTDTYSKVRSAA